MKTENNRQYYCDEGKVFIRRKDGFVMGDGLCLGINDNIENYEEIDDPNPVQAEEEKKPKKRVERQEKQVVKEEKMLAASAPKKKAASRKKKITA